MTVRSDIRVSYIISTRNRAPFLAKTLSNVREFMTPADELLIIDGASTDNTPAIMEANRDIVTLFISEPDKGEAHGFNKGILASRGEFIKFLTDDDYTYPATMKAAIREMEEDEDIDVLLCGGEHYKMNSNGELELDFYFRLTGDRAERVGRPVRETGDTAGPGLALILRRRIVPLVGLLETSFLCTDTEFLARLKRPEVNLRYYDVKLYRHIDYPHSGVLNVDRANCDAVRAYVRSGAWVQAMQYRPEIIAKALGLNNADDGHDIAIVLHEMMRLQKCSAGRNVVALTAMILRVSVKAASTLLRFARQQHQQVFGGPANASPESEPQWTFKIV